MRWIQSYECIAEQASELPGTRHVCIGDCESDILVLLVIARKINPAADYLVHCQHNRVLPEGGQAVGWCHGQRVVLPDRQGGQLEVTCLVALEV